MQYELKPYQSVVEAAYCHEYAAADLITFSILIKAEKNTAENIWCTYFSTFLV